MTKHDTSPPQVVTLQIKLGTIWSAEIEFIDLSTLEDVHLAIQDAVQFDNDHLYAFFIARNERASDKIFFDDENEGVFDTQIRDLFPLPPKKSFYYLFDWGDTWIFKVLRSRKKPRPPEDQVDYPRVVKETGEKPTQYEYDDEFEDEDEDDW